MNTIPGPQWHRLNEYLAAGQLNPPTTRRGETTSPDPNTPKGATPTPAGFPLNHKGGNDEHKTT